MNFEKYGFSNGRVLVPGLEFIVDLGKDKYFRNDGVVWNVDAHAHDVREELALNVELARGYLGLHIPILDDTGGNLVRGSVVFWRGFGNGAYESYDVFCAGHEVWHALEFLRMGECLTEDLHRNGFKMNPFDRYKDRELRAHSGGVLACFKKRLNVPVGIHPDIKLVFRDMLESRVAN